MGVYTYPRKARVQQVGYMGCQKCQPRPFSERKWYAVFPGDPYSYKEFPTWAEAMAMANTYREPVMMNYTSGNSTITATYPSWINNHKWG